MADSITCPACDGSGQSTVSYVADYAGGRFESRSGVCGSCSGSGEIDQTRETDVIKGTSFREARRANGESLMEVATRMEISPAYLSRLERGHEQWPDGERSIALDRCTCAERAPDNLMDFPDVNRLLWLMAAGQSASRLVDPDRPYVWWCRQCGWPLTPLGRHFEIELGEFEDDDQQ